jgi:hypothetical protein
MKALMSLMADKFPIPRGFRAHPSWARYDTDPGPSWVGREIVRGWDDGPRDREWREAIGAAEWATNRWVAKEANMVRLRDESVRSSG